MAAHRETLGGRQASEGQKRLGGCKWQGARTTPSLLQLVYASPPCPSARQSRDHPPRPLGSRLAPPAAPALLFASFAESQDLLAASFRDPSAWPRPLPLKPSLLFFSRPTRIVSYEWESLFLPARLPSAAVCPSFREGGERWRGTLFRGGGRRRPWPFHDGGGAVRPRWRRPVGWRDCEVNS